MQTTWQHTSTKPNLSEEGPIRGKQYMRSGPHTGYSSCINQGTTIYVGHRWVWAIHKWPKLGQVREDLAMANYVAQVVDLALKKHAFLYLHI